MNNPNPNCLCGIPSQSKVSKLGNPYYGCQNKKATFNKTTNQWVTTQGCDFYQKIENTNIPSGKTNPTPAYGVKPSLEERLEDLERRVKGLEMDDPSLKDIPF